MFRVIDPMSSVFIRILLVGGALLLVVAWWQRESLPPQNGLDSALLSEPQQLPTTKAPFKTRVGGIEYTVRPLYTYDLYGLVVSKHDADTWWDYIHRSWQDRLNVADLCVIWGANARSGSYRELDYWSSQFECYAETSSTAAWQAFDVTALSNNHLLADDPVVARAVKSMRVGDQIHVRGYLAEYSHDHGFHFFRGTSTTRTDQGAHACETVYATDAEILRAGNGGWRTMFWVAVVALAIGIVGWIRMPFRATR
jgi:hypothetical protein